jgi:KaiC/GvpD/RAD55 family RecA-like ATPase
MSTQLPSVHSVHFYTEGSALISRLCGIVSAGLQIGDAILIVATADHRDQLVKQLQDNGVDVRRFAREGQYTMVDAGEMLKTFMRNGMPDPRLFTSSVGATLTQARKGAHSAARGLTVFGEMVAVLWEEGRKEAALRLETLWNEALNDRSFHLHCAYLRGSFMNEADEAEICSAHTHFVVQ